jgi:POT family proton-dependent oligopeptide transporter
MTLFFTEMWERFSYYGMRAFLILYMVAPIDKGGLGFSEGRAGIIYGMYTASVYLMSVPGGWIADRFLGLRNAVFYGGILIMCGHIVLALPIGFSFYLGLILIVLGTGLLKANISTIVGQLYGKDDPRRDAGYSIYYMGINIGAFFAPIACGWLVQSDTFREFIHDSLGMDPNLAWHVGFAAAAVGMALGVVQYKLGIAAFGDAGAHPTPPANEGERRRNVYILIGILTAIVVLPSLLFGLVALDVLGTEGVGNVFGVLLLVTAVGVFVTLYTMGCQNVDEKRRLTVILLLFVGACIFWGCFEQAGSVLNLFATSHTDKTIFGWAYPSTWLQSANSVFIIAFAPIFAWLWMAWNKRGSEPSSPAKFGAGLVLVGAGFAVMIPAAMAIGDSATTTVTPLYLITLYLFHTFAELCLSPVGLSSMSKLAPARWGGLVMGIWFLGASIGNFLAGRAVEYSKSMSPTSFFTMMVLIPLALSAVFFALVKPIGRMLARS